MKPIKQLYNMKLNKKYMYAKNFYGEAYILILLGCNHYKEDFSR